MDKETSAVTGPTTCRAKGLPLCEPKTTTLNVEIVPFVKIEHPAPAKTFLCDCALDDDSTALEDDDENSLKEPSTIDDQLQVENIEDELSKQKQRVQLIDNIYDLNTPYCPIGDPCVDMEIEINKFKVHPEILELQRNNHKLRQQLKEMQQCCTASDIIVKSLLKSISRDMETVAQLKSRFGKVDSFKRNLEYERMLCGQRYRYLMREMYDWDECNWYIQNKLKEAEKEHVKHVARIDYKDPKHEAIDRLNQAKLDIKEVHDAMYKSTWSPRNRESSEVYPQLGSEISAFLQRNEQLFKESH
ncbi:hypothetical protein KR215_008212 [Drosophila sulfurigaster]|nr:hypothetical protein KR215_008212 [Drosophila sulfurigaster]